LQGKHARQFNKAYNDLFDRRREIADLVKGEGKGLVSVDRFMVFYGESTNNLSDLDSIRRDILSPVEGISEDNPNYLLFISKFQSSILTYIQAREAYDELLSVIEGKEYRHFLNNESRVIEELETRIDRLRGEIKAINEKLSGVEEPMAKFRLWTESLLGSIPTSLLVEFAVSEESESKQEGLRKLDCLAFEQSYRLATGVDLRGLYSNVIPDKPRSNVAKGDLVALPLGLPPPPTVYRAVAEWIFVLPPTGQTLLVTLILGGLGAVTLNLLRLSRFGWWGAAPTPDWGEVLFGPLLGAMAAFGIFLIAKTGLLLASGNAQTDVQTLSAFFIGLLGFVSGLLYDQAFARVRLVGAGIFGGKVEGSVALRDPGDLELAQLFEVEHAPVAAMLVRAAKLGAKLSEYPRFTLFMPVETAIPPDVVTAALKAESSGDMSEIRAWFDGQIAVSRLGSADLTKLAALAQPEIEMSNGIKRKVELVSGVVKVGGASVVKNDLSWRTGIVHIIDAAFS
jgi:hypothetical protein